MFHWLKNFLTGKKTVVILHTIYPGEAFRVEQALQEAGIWCGKDIGGTGDVSYSTRNVTKLSVKTEEEHKAREILRNIQRD
ncbi:hypothetical protein [Salibacterium aidingense]|uniref:hypothetical protein n=1 Tax=Salibacterium aidingense TaxID=384933 RepID=UPI0004132FB1|nr:hypothetical protein [Salibacterium aidingense]